MLRVRYALNAIYLAVCAVCTVHVQSLRSFKNEGLIQLCLKQGVVRCFDIIGSEWQTVVLRGNGQN